MNKTWSNYALHDYILVIGMVDNNLNLALVPIDTGQKLKRKRVPRYSFIRWPINYKAETKPKNKENPSKYPIIFLSENMFNLILHIAGPLTYIYIKN